jgi:hypothetical protein
MRPKDIQDSINIALDAADAATDVTAEYSKIKRENKALEANVKQIHRSTTIIFYSAMITTVVATIFAGLVYFRTMSDLNSITSTSREALVVFAENVNEVNNTLTSLKAGYGNPAGTGQPESNADYRIAGAERKHHHDP